MYLEQRLRDSKNKCSDWKARLPVKPMLAHFVACPTVLAGTMITDQVDNQLCRIMFLRDQRDKFKHPIHMQHRSCMDLNRNLQLHKSPCHVLVRVCLSSPQVTEQSDQSVQSLYLPIQHLFLFKAERS